jgi:hypothetical protein
MACIGIGPLAHKASHWDYSGQTMDDFGGFDVGDIA